MVEKLDDLELEEVVGGKSARAQMMNIACSCGTVNSVDVSKSSFTCKSCGKNNKISG